MRPSGKNLELQLLTIFVTFHSTGPLVNKARSLDYYKVSWYGSWHWSTWRTTFMPQLFKATKRIYFCCIRCSNPACTIGQNLANIDILQWLDFYALLRVKSTRKQGASIGSFPVNYVFNRFSWKYRASGFPGKWRVRSLGSNKVLVERCHIYRGLCYLRNWMGAHTKGPP